MHECELIIRHVITLVTLIKQIIQTFPQIQMKGKHE